MKTRVSFVLGGPASGKGLFCELFTKQFMHHTKHISAGNCLREEINQCLIYKDSPNINKNRYERSLNIKALIDQGNIVPASITVELLRERINNNKKIHYLIDGFPRNWENLKVWEELMDDHTEIKHAFFLECNEETMFNR